MRRERLGGWCMIAGAVMGVVTMAFHPTRAERAGLALAVHALALAAAPLALYGGWALTRRLSAGGAAAELALSFYAMSMVATLLAAASSVAIGLWSIEIVRTRLLHRAKGLFGCIVAALVLLALFSGHLRMDVHGFGAVVLSQAVWLVLVGAELLGAGNDSES